MIGSTFASGVFLSTPSARRATGILFRPVMAADDFYPRPPRGGRLWLFLWPVIMVWISIHALREEGDLGDAEKANTALEFLSTPSARRATATASPPPVWYRFLSTPSARRATFPYGTKTDPSQHFYPRPPRGGRRMFRPMWCSRKRFLSTPSARRATAKTEKNISAFVSL